MIHHSLTLGFGAGIALLAMVEVKALEPYRHSLLLGQSGAELLEQGGPIESQGVPVPQPAPNLEGADRQLEESADLARQQAASDIIRQAQDYSLLNDGYVGNPNYVGWTGGEQMGLDYLTPDPYIGSWGDGYWPYTLGF
ncbi:hypothetical protein L3556_08505 [Candidatus Synechococcus calcipolaris G9]|uniref:Uncharacterized protein n=1 Tax=Candidatus Synechococcus calcipolaris G9 TaxID=1497997 RepID=A0ABT6EZF6_9SYNE|nr:hypothetical protein [Candidatus Synechococcus calcipolaris]MDG2990966.1 hypothetical protein [Candidatus Synechococcus calcipolaris G9]